MIIRPRAETRDLASSGQAAAITVASLAALKALVSRPASVLTKYRSTVSDNGGGVWVWRSGDQSANVSADTRSGIWAAPNSDSTGASGAWRRQFDGMPNARWFGGTLAGEASDDDALEAGLSVAAGLSQPLYAVGGFNVTRTITWPVDGQLEGDFISRTVITRDTDYGWTFTCGSSVSAVNAIKVRNVWFKHSTQYTAGDAALANKATTGGWFEIYGSQEALFENCRFWRLPYCLYFKGGALPTVKNCSFNGTWDHSDADCQESIANIVLENSATLGHPQLAVIDGCAFAGSVSAVRSVTINGVAQSMSEVIGPKYGVLVKSIEGLAINNCYFTGHNVASIAFNGAAINSTIRISNTWLDACRGESLQFQPSNWSYPTVDFVATNILANGQLSGQRVVAAYKSGTDPSLLSFSLDIKSRATFATPIYLEGAVGGTVTGVYTWYNGRDLDPSNASYCAAVYITGICKYVVVKNAIVGGGGNNFTAVGGASNYCYRGIVIDETCGADGCYQVGTVNAGVTSAGLLVPQTVAGLPSAAANQGNVRVVIDATATTRRSIAAGGGANTVIVMSDGSNWLIV